MFTNGMACIRCCQNSGSYILLGFNLYLTSKRLLPYWVPFHPGRMWCHCRQIYLPMSYCYAHRLKAEETELIRQLRTELYTDKYENLDWVAARNQVAKVDCYAPHHVLLDIANGLSTICLASKTLAHV